MAKQILLVEDNKDMAQLLALHLRDLRHDVELCFDGDTALRHIEQKHYDLVILDLMLPGTDGLSICQFIRSKSNYTPVVILTAKGAELDRVMGLESGADDYITKPFSISEVLARIKALFRRMDALAQDQQSNQSRKIHCGDMLIDLEKHLVVIAGRPIELTAKEFDLLVFFAKRPGHVFSRNELLNKVWGYYHDGYEHTVNSHINRLRVKIEDDPKNPVYIQTIWGVGYKFSDTLNDV